MDWRRKPKLRSPLALKPITVFTVKAMAGVSLFPWRPSSYMTNTAKPTKVEAIGISCSKLRDRMVSKKRKSSEGQERRDAPSHGESGHMRTRQVRRFVQSKSPHLDENFIDEDIIRAMGLDQHSSHPLDEVRLPSVHLDRFDGRQNLESLMNTLQCVKGEAIGTSLIKEMRRSV